MYLYSGKVYLEIGIPNMAAVGPSTSPSLLGTESQHTKICPRSKYFSFFPEHSHQGFVKTFIN